MGMRGKVAAAMTALAVLVPAGAAVGGGAEEAELTLERTSLGVKGDVDAKSKFCRDRIVLLMQKLDGEDTLIQSQDANPDSGKWRISLELEPGTYYARVGKRVKGDKRCAPARSNQIREN